MVGSRHSPTPHATLSILKVPNIKLKDNRAFEYGSNNTLPKGYKKLALVSELQTTFDPNRILRGLFSINAELLLLTHTKYGKAFYNLKSSEYDKLLSSFSIRSVRLYKNRVSQSKKTKKIHKVFAKELLIKTKDEPGQASLINNIRMKSKSSYGHNNIIDIKSEKFLSFRPFLTLLREE